MKKFIAIALLLLSFGLQAQEKYTISGIVKEASSGEALIGATVYDETTKAGISTNVYGFYSLTLPKGKHIISFSFVGYNTVIKEIDLSKDLKINIELGGVVELEEVVVSANSVSKKVESSQMSLTNINVEKIKSLPAFMGESDVIKTIQLLPGIQSGSEGSSGIYVRGGGPDQNLLMLDGVPVYNANHLFGFFSVFNPDAVHYVDVYKGGFPARFGGRLSSVIDIRMKEGNMKEYHGSVSVGIISSKINFEGPIIKDRTSFNISARRTYIDLLIKPFQKSDKFGYYFYDLNAKINHKFSDKSRLFLSAYLGSDKGGGESNDKEIIDDSSRKEIKKDKSNNNFDWGNKTLALRWNYIFSPKLFSNTTVTYSKYDFGLDFDSSEERYLKYSTSSSVDEDYKERTKFKYTSGIYDFAYKFDLDYLPNPNHSIKIGASYIYHSFIPGENIISVSKTDNLKPKGAGNEDVTYNYGNKNIYAHEGAAYIEDDYKISESLKANVGLHYSLFNVQKNTYQSFEPRLAVRYLVNEDLSLKLAYSKMQQYIHLLSNSTISMPTDLWLPVTKRIKPMKSTQYALGAAYNLGNGYDFTVEGFYKEMDNLIEYKDGTTFFSYNSKWEDLVEMGKGKAYGIELQFNKTIGKTTGWIGYTLSKTDRDFPTINYGKTFAAKYDRRHDVSIVITHKPSKKIDFGMTWVYGTGNSLTMSTRNMDLYLDKFIVNDSYTYTDKSNMKIPIPEGRNNYRAPAYHRLDFSVNFHKKKKYGTRTWNISVYNVYNRSNPFYLHFSNKGDHKVLKQTSLFTIIPSVSYIFTF